MRWTLKAHITLLRLLPPRLPAKRHWYPSGSRILCCSSFRSVSVIRPRSPELESSQPRFVLSFLEGALSRGNTEGIILPDERNWGECAGLSLHCMRNNETGLMKRFEQRWLCLSGFKWLHLMEQMTHKLLERSLLTSPHYLTHYCNYEKTMSNIRRAVHRPPFPTVLY